MKSPSQLLAEAQARGAIIVDDSKPSQGFADDNTHDPSYDDPAVLELMKRSEDAAALPAEVDELTKQLRESNVNAVRQFRFIHQQDYLEWVPGRIMRLGEFLTTLQTIRPDAFLAEYSYLGLRGLGFVVNGKPQYSGVSTANGTMPEYTQLREDRHALVSSEKYRGWRMVLLAIIKGGFITVEQADAAFGKPSGPRSRPWYRQLFAIRNGYCPECKKEQCDCLGGYDYLRADNYTYAIPSEVVEGKHQVIDTAECLIWTP